MRKRSKGRKEKCENARNIKNEKKTGRWGGRSGNKEERFQNKTRSVKNIVERK
jgi:hypothetical protein